MNTAAVPSKASTVIVVRPDKTGGFEVLMTRRPQAMKFLGGFVVFPGGALEEEDWSETMLARCRGLNPLDAQKLLGNEMSPELSLGHWVAAVRELFEETGIHFFFTDQSLSCTDSAGAIDRLAEKRKILSEGRITLPQLLLSEELFCDLGRLDYFFHRVTPENYKVRFDTRFYLAALPANQIALSASEEVAETLWIAPRKALDQSQAGQFPMMPPTIIALRALAEHRSWNQLRSAHQLI